MSPWDDLRCLWLRCFLREFLLSAGGAVISDEMAVLGKLLCLGGALFWGFDFAGLWGLSSWFLGVPTFGLDFVLEFEVASCCPLLDCLFLLSVEVVTSERDSDCLFVRLSLRAPDLTPAFVFGPFDALFGAPL